MKTIITALLSLLSTAGILSQCSDVSIQISSSDTSYIQLYNAGIFLIPSGENNVCVWEVTDFSGAVVHQDTTSGVFEDQSFSYFDHMISINDSMKATLEITNEDEGSICTINDTLYWKETEVLPGSFIGSWDVLSSNGGVEDFEVSPTEFNSKDLQISIYPSPATHHFSINGTLEKYDFSIINSKGQIIKQYYGIINQESIDISDLVSGLYYIYFTNNQRRTISVKKITIQ